MTGDPLQSLLDIVIVSQAPKHIGMPPKYHSGSPNMSLSWGNVSVSKVKFNILSINSGKTIVKLYWSAFFRIDKVGNVPKKVLKHCCQLGGIKKIWGRGKDGMKWDCVKFVEASYLRQRRAHLVGTVRDRRQNSQAQFLLRKHSSQALQQKISSPAFQS